MEERQTNFTVAEGYELPSKGLIYGDKNVSSHIELRSMTAKDEMKRLNPSSTPFKNLADIIEGCMIEKPAIHVYDMALGDYEFLLHRLRVVTYGPNYKTSVTCPYCGTTTEATCLLDSLEVKEFDIDKFNEFRTFILPDCGRTVTIKFQTPHIMDELDSRTKEMKRKYKDATTDFHDLILLTLMIEAVDGEPKPKSELEGFINKLSAKDFMKIINNINRLNNCIGIKNEFYVTCEGCDQELKTFFRFGQEFFRPSDI